MVSGGTWRYLVIRRSTSETGLRPRCPQYTSHPPPTMPLRKRSSADRCLSRKQLPFNPSGVCLAGRARVYSPATTANNNVLPTSILRSFVESAQYLHHSQSVEETQRLVAKNGTHVCRCQGMSRSSISIPIRHVVQPASCTALYLQPTIFVLDVPAVCVPAAVFQPHQPQPSHGIFLQRDSDHRCNDHLLEHGTKCCP